MQYLIIRNKSHLFFLIIIITFLLPGCKQDQNWHYSVNSYGLKELYTDTKSEILGTQSVTRLKFIRAGDEKGNLTQAYLSMEFTISPYSGIRDFDFEKFEGPHSAAGGMKLMSVTLTGKDGKTVYGMSQAGWISAEIDDGFTFGTGAAVIDKNSSMRKIIRDINLWAEKIEISVRGIKKDIIISSVFSIDKGRNYFKVF